MYVLIWGMALQELTDLATQRVSFALASVQTIELHVG